MSAKSRRVSKQKLVDSLPAMPEDLTTFRPKVVDKIDVAFGAAGRLHELLPPRESLPDEFRAQRGPWCELASRWFFQGLKGVDLVAKSGIDKNVALAHLSAIMGSWEPKHEHKIGGVGFLMSLWFEPVISETK
jgi:hypothetical protein